MSYMSSRLHLILHLVFRFVGCHSGRSVSHNINGEMVKVSAFMGMHFKYAQNTSMKEPIERPRGYSGVDMSFNGVGEETQTCYSFSSSLTMLSCSSQLSVHWKLFPQAP